ncbi:Uncharacterised protein [Shewanella baltica]|uniref:hypothetical protein n=1 Tax=Shewanella TaxID=22 RepID=UPI000F6CBDE8|nr:MULTISPECIES: hypothetical protein [Shewanella]MCB2380963.1 hypothetical protein [Shewanella sp. SR1]VEF25659.1 Uncharacterised protein [Shewanella baltica]
MKSLTLKELINKLLDFNLFVLVKYFQITLVVATCALVGLGSIYIWRSVQESTKQVKIGQLEVEFLKIEQERYKLNLPCFDESTVNREEFEFYVELDSCLKSRDLTEHEVKVLKAIWSDELSRVMTFFQSSYYKSGPVPRYCTYDGHLMIVCNNGNRYTIEL